MIDQAHSATDEELKKIESRVKAIYTQAQKEITESWDAYMAESKSQLSELQKAYEDAKKAGDKKQMKITGIKLAQAKKEITIQNKRFQDMINDVAYRISTTNQIAVDYINGKMPSIYTVNYNAVNGDAVKAGIDFSLVDEHTVRKMIIDGDISLPQRKVDIPKDMLWNKRQINSSVLQGIIQGESIEKIAGRISPIIQNNANSSIRLARTMTTAAECGGRIDSYHELESLGAVQKKVWMATPDDRTRPSHIDIDGEEQNIDDLFSNGCQYPGDGNGPADEVWNCFPAETAIATDCDIISSYKRWYDGHLIKIKTANGVCFSCTPNHPILTSGGWIKANSLHNGDDLLVTFIGDDSVSVLWRNPNINHIFPRMDTFHKAFYMVFGERARDLTMNLHGDIPTADVEVVSQKRFLRVCRDSRIVKGLYKLMLKFSYALLSCKRNFVERFISLISSTNSFMSGSGKRLTFFGRSLRHTQIHSFGTITRGDAALVKISDDNRTADPELFCKSFDRLSGVVFLDEIIDIQVDDFHGYVYNLQTDNNYYFVNSNLSQNAGKVNGIFAIAHNCRCSIRTNIIGFMRSDGSVSKIDYERKPTMHDKQMAEEKERRRNNE